jgi:hypothetical protein
MRIAGQTSEIAGTWKHLLGGLIRQVDVPLPEAQATQGGALGISLAYLEAVTATLSELRQGYYDFPAITSELCSNIIVPALSKPSSKTR